MANEDQLHKRKATGQDDVSPASDAVEVGDDDIIETGDAGVVALDEDAEEVVTGEHDVHPPTADSETSPPLSDDDHAADSAAEPMEEEAPPEDAEVQSGDEIQAADEAGDEAAEPAGASTLDERAPDSSEDTGKKTLAGEGAAVPPPWSEEEITGPIGRPPLEEGASPKKSRRGRRLAESVGEQEVEEVHGASEEAGTKENTDPWRRERTAVESGGKGEDEAEANADAAEGTATEDQELAWTAPKEPETEAAALPDAGPTRIEQPAVPAPNISSEKTQILGPQVEEPPLAYLVIVQGEEEGREIDLVGAQVSMGRGADNDLVFPDIACSRRHALLEKQGNDYVVNDLGSGNGTLVNGRRIQRAKLEDGDEIEVGNTVLQFKNPGAGAPAQAASAPESTVTRASTLPASKTKAGGGFLSDLLADPRRKKLVFMGGGAVVGLILLMVIIKAAVGPGNPKAPSKDELERQELLEAKKELTGHIQAAAGFVKDKKWKEASLEAQLALKIDPEDHTAKDYQATAQKELAANQALTSAHTLIDTKAWEAAMKTIGTIPNDSDYAEEALKLKPQIEQGMIDDFMQQGQDFLKEKQYSQAARRFEEVIRRRPDHVEAIQLKRQCDDEVSKEEQRLARLEVAKHQIHSNIPAKPKKDSSSSAITGQVLALYRNGEVDKAIDKAETDGASQQAAKLKKFRGLFEKGKEFVQHADQVGKAIESLKQAFAVDAEIAGGSGKYHDDLTNLLGKQYFKKGVESFSGKDYPDAYKSFTAALKYAPTLNLAKERLGDLEKQAKKLFEEAYIIKPTNPEEAIKKLSIVLQIIPPDNPYYTKAQRLKTSLQGPGGEESPGGEGGF